MESSELNKMNNHEEPKTRKNLKFKKEVGIAMKSKEISI